MYAVYHGPGRVEGHRLLRIEAASWLAEELKAADFEIAGEEFSTRSRSQVEDEGNHSAALELGIRPGQHRRHPWSSRSMNV